MGTHVLLESAKVANIKRFIHVSTDEVYGEQTNDQEAMSEEQVRDDIRSHFMLTDGSETKYDLTSRHMAITHSFSHLTPHPLKS